MPKEKDFQVTDPVTYQNYRATVTGVHGENGKHDFEIRYIAADGIATRKDVKRSEIKKREIKPLK